MQLEITVDYRVPADEFEDLIKVHTLGKYHLSNNCNWFSVVIDSADGQIRLTWFKVW